MIRADTVLLLEHGRIVQQGGPKQLLESGGPVSRFFGDQLQAAAAINKQDNSKFREGSEGGQKAKMNSGKHVTERSNSSTSKPFSPNAPEFVPHHNQTEAEISNGQNAHPHPIAAHRVSHRESSAHARSHAIRSASSERVPKPDHRPRTPVAEHPGPTPPKQAEEDQKEDTSSKYDGPAERNIGKQPAPRLNRWQRRRLARSDPQSIKSEAGNTGTPAKTSSGSPSRVRQALRHVSGPGHFPSGVVKESNESTNATISGVEDQQTPRGRRQRHLRIKKYRDQAAARNKVTTDGLYTSNSHATGSSSTLMSNPIMVSGAASIREEPEPQAKEAANLHSSQQP